MFHKDTFRLIKKTFNRFFSLMMMVLIGVAFMMGLLSTKSVMKTSVDVFNDELNLHDLQIYSSYGFDDEDVEALSQVEGVSGLFASKMVDCYCENPSGEEVVARVEEINRSVSGFQLTDGRMPESANEVVLLTASVSPTNYSLGSTLRFYFKDDDDPITDKLQNTEYTIVGFAESPCYISKVLGTSIIDNMDLDIVCYIPDENFLADYYTTIYLSLEGAEEEISYTDEYAALVEDRAEAVKLMAEDQQEHRKAQVLAEYEEEIAEGEAKLAKEKAKGEKKLASAKKTLDASATKLAVAELQIETNKATVEASEAQLEASKQLLEENEKLLNEAVEQVEAADSKGRSFDKIYSELESTYNAYETLKAVVTWSGPDLDLDENVIEVLKRLGYGFTLTKAGLQKVMDAIDENAGGSIETTYANLTGIKNGLAQLESGKKQLEEGEAELKDGKAQLEAYEEKIASGRKAYEKGLKEYNEGLEEFNTKIEKAETELKNARQQLEELPGASWTILTRDSHYSSYMYKSSCDQMGSIGTTLPLLFFLVAGLVCMTTMTRLIDEQRGQIGIFRALGFSKGKIVSKYVIYSLMASLAGSIPGVVVGMALFPTVIYNTWRLMYILPPMQVVISPVILLICVCAFSVLMMGVSTVVVMRSLKEVPSQLMRPKAPKNAKPVFLEKIGFIWKHMSFTSKITARNLIRYKSRFLMTVIGVAGCTGLLVVGWGIKDSISDIIEIQYGEIFAYDYMVNINSDADIEEFTEILEDDFNNSSVVPYMQYTSKLYGGKDDDQTMTVQIMDARDSSYIMGFRETDGKTPLSLNNSGVLVSEKFAKTNGIEAGDTIEIESESGYKAEVYVTGVCEMYFQHYIFISESYYNKIFGETVTPTGIAVVTSDGDALANSISGLEGYVSVVDFSSMKASFENMLEALDFIILVIIATAGALALVVLINLTQVNISERLREIATLKVLGFRTGEVNSYLFKEIFLLSVIGGLVGLPLGVAEHHFIMNIIQMDMVRFGNNIRPLSFTYAFLVTIAFTVLVLQLTKKPLKKIQMVESLKSVE